MQMQLLEWKIWHEFHVLKFDVKPIKIWCEKDKEKRD